ncbi:MAG: DMT family transporter [Acidobacteriota bacterium]|nr:MAG: DMT family transporter [Acidobacteriota bacterium]
MFLLLSGHWLGPTLVAFLLYGISGGLFKQALDDIPVSRFCLYTVVVDAVVYMSFFLYWHKTGSHPPPFAPEGLQFFFWAMVSGLLEGIAGILYYESLSGGPVSIVGTVSAAYPVATAVLAFIFLGELLIPTQYIGAALVVAGCIGIAYEPSDPDQKTSTRRALGMPLWFVYAILAALLWGIGGAMNRWVYELPNASEANFALYGIFADVLTIGVYGALLEREWKFPVKEGAWAALPLAISAVADGVLYLAYRLGPATLVTTLSGAYPAVTLVYAYFVIKERPTFLQWVCIALVFIGMLLSPGA